MSTYDPQNPPLMGCGHTANSTVKGKDGLPDRPACAICVCIVPGWDNPVEVKPSLDGRMARCGYDSRLRGGQHEGRNHNRAGESPTPSRWGLPFFEHRPDKDEDAFYCGCWGWD